MAAGIEREALDVLLEHFRRIGAQGLSYRQAELLVRGREYLVPEEVPFVADVARARASIQGPESRTQVRHLWQVVFERGPAEGRAEAAAQVVRGRSAVDLARLPLAVLMAALEPLAGDDNLPRAIEQALLRVPVWDGQAWDAARRLVSTGAAWQDLRQRFCAEVVIGSSSGDDALVLELLREDPELCADEPARHRLLARDRVARNDLAPARASFESLLSTARSDEDHRGALLELLAVLRSPATGGDLEPIVALGLARYPADVEVLAALRLLCAARELPIAAALAVIEACEDSGVLAGAASVGEKEALCARARAAGDRHAMSSLLDSLRARNPGATDLVEVLRAALAADAAAPSGRAGTASVGEAPAATPAPATAEAPERTAPPSSSSP